MAEDPTADVESESETKKRNFVERSSSRTAVLGRLVEGPADPSKVATERSRGVANVKETAGSLSVTGAKTASEELRERGLVELLVAEDERAYSLTEEGERVLFALQEKGVV